MLAAFACLVIIAADPAPPTDAEIDAWKKDFQAKVISYNEKTVEQLRAFVIQQRRQRKNPANTLARIKSIEAGNFYIPPLESSNRGAVGRFASHIDRQGSPNSMVAEIAQIVDANNMLVASPYGDRLWFWLRTSTKDKIDGQEIELSGVYVVEGTKQYATGVGGSNTVRVYLEVPAAEWMPNGPLPK